MLLQVSDGSGDVGLQADDASIQSWTVSGCFSAPSSRPVHTLPAGHSARPRGSRSSPSPLFVFVFEFCSTCDLSSVTRTRARPSFATAADPVALPLPYLHLCVAVPTLSTNPKELSQALWSTYSSLLAASEARLASLDDRDLPPSGAKRESYNMFLSVTHMHLVPRTNRLVVIPRILSKDKQPGDRKSVV